MTQRSDNRTVEVVRLYKSDPEGMSGWAKAPDGKRFIFHCDFTGEKVSASRQLYLNHRKGHPNLSVGLSKDRAQKIGPQIWAALLDYPRENGRLVPTEGTRSYLTEAGASQ